jgi:hypothetical protein
VKVIEWTTTPEEILTKPTPVSLNKTSVAEELGTTAGLQLAAVFQSVPGPIQSAADALGAAARRDTAAAARTQAARREFTR